MQTFNNVTIIRDPPGTLVSGSTNTFEYPILSNVTLTCATDPMASSATFQWLTARCTACFPSGQTNQNISSVLTPEDAGTFTCSVNGGGDDFPSESFTLRVTCKLAMQLEADVII